MVLLVTPLRILEALTSGAASEECPAILRVVHSSARRPTYLEQIFGNKFVPRAVHKRGLAKCWPGASRAGSVSACETTRRRKALTGGDPCKNLACPSDETHDTRASAAQSQLPAKHRSPPKHQLLRPIAAGAHEPNFPLLARGLGQVLVCTRIYASDLQ